MSDIEKLDPNFAAPEIDDRTAWYDLRSLSIEGRHWPDEPRTHDYHRFPARCEGVVPQDVWKLAGCSTGMYARFVTDATTIAVRWTLTCNNTYMAHMPPTGHSGLDLYAQDQGTWRFAGVAQPEKDQADQQCTLIAGMNPATRHFMLYLPLYNGVRKVQIGLPCDSTLQPPPPWPRNHAKPMCFYGTSIVHGGCASRPGMNYASILSRRLNHPAMNMGFSGHGRCQSTVGDLLAELDPSIYILDPLPNLQASDVKKQCEPFITTLHKAHPNTPIIMIEHIHYQQGHLSPDRAERTRATNQAWHALHATLLASGMKPLHYLENTTLLGDDNEAAVDGTHLTDLGYVRFADALEPTLKAILDAT